MKALEDIIAGCEAARKTRTPEANRDARAFYKALRRAVDGDKRLIELLPNIYKDMARDILARDSGKGCLECAAALKFRDLGEPVCPYCGVA